MAMDGCWMDVMLDVVDGDSGDEDDDDRSDGDDEYAVDDAV